MKKYFLVTLMLLAVSTLVSANKKENTLPSIDVKTTDGRTVNTSAIQNDGKPIIISFWATWCKPCVKELTSISEVYEEWQEETGVKLVAVSIDDARSSAKVLPLVNGKSWDYEILLDVNGDFKRAMGVNLVPHTFLLDGKGEIVWQHTSFSEGAELDLIEKIKELTIEED